MGLIVPGQVESGQCCRGAGGLVQTRERRIGRGRELCRMADGICWDQGQGDDGMTWVERGATAAELLVL